MARIQCVTSRLTIVRIVAAFTLQKFTQTKMKASKPIGRAWTVFTKKSEQANLVRRAKRSIILIRSPRCPYCNHELAKRNDGFDCYMREAIESWSGQYVPDDSLFGWFHTKRKSNKSEKLKIRSIRSGELK